MSQVRLNVSKILFYLHFIASWHKSGCVGVRFSLDLIVSFGLVLMLLGAQINPFLIPRSAIFGWCTSYALCQILRFLSPSSSLFLFGWGNNLGLSGISFGVGRNFLGLFRIPTLSARFFPLPQFLWCCTSTEYGHQGMPYFAAGQKDRVAFSRLARRKILNKVCGMSYLIFSVLNFVPFFVGFEKIEKHLVTLFEDENLTIVRESGQLCIIFGVCPFQNEIISINCVDLVPSLF